MQTNPRQKNQVRPGLFRGRLSRRQVLQMLAAGASSGALAGCAVGSNRARGFDQVGGARATDAAIPGADATPRVLPDDPPRLMPGAVADRILVLIELGGGNDGLSTVVPYTEGFLRDGRPDLLADDDDLLILDDRIALAPQFHRLHRRGLTVVEGVGVPDHSLSHFAMERRWQQGDALGDGSGRLGFLGSLADALDTGGVAAGLSVSGVTPWLSSGLASTLALQDPNGLWMLRDTDWDLQRRYLSALDSLYAESADASSYRSLRSLANAIPEREETEDESPEADILDDMLDNGGQLAQQLRTAADLISADVGIRVIHARIDGFDTHDDHQWAHPGLLSQIDAGVDGFLRLMEARGLGERVLVATVSEFGRRVRQNGQGLDHGAASTMLVAGPVPNRILGEPSPVGARKDLDEDGNLRMTTGMDSYLGSLAQEWLGVEAASVLTTAPALLGLV